MEKNRWPLAFFLLGFCFSIDAQPLQFLYEKDSLRLFDVDVEATADGGWLVAGAGMDSSIAIMKFDHCGKVQWKEKVVQSGTFFRQLHFLIDNNTLYLAAATRNGQDDPIYVLKYRMDQSTKEEAWLSLQRVNNKQRPSIAVAPSGRIELGFSGGDDSTNLNGYLLHLDNGLGVLGADVYEGQAVVSLTYKGDDEFLATLGQNVVMQYNQAGIQWSRLIKDHQHLQRNILYSRDNDIIVLGRDLSSSRPSLRLIKMDRSGRLVEMPQPSIVPYVPSFPTKLIEGGGAYWVVYGSAKDSLKAIAYTSFTKNLKWSGTNLYVMNKAKDSIQSAGITFLEKENNFAATAANVDSLSFFYAKANNKFSFSCRNEEEVLPSIIERFVESDTVEISYAAALAAGFTESVEIMNFDVEFKQRRCYKFDLKDGNIPYPPACKGDNVVFNAGVNNPFYTFRWSNGQTGSSIEVKAPAEASVMITYCDMTVNITHKVEEINLNQTIPYPTTCIGKDTVFVAFFQPDKFKYTWPNGSKEKTIKVNVPQTLVATVTCNQSVGRETHTIAGEECLHLPNVFFPGSAVEDNKIYNAVSKIPNEIKAFEMKIYNRWGQMVFDSNSIDRGWDGNYKGEPAPSETYLVFVQAIIGQQKVELKSPLTLVR